MNALRSLSLIMTAVVLSTMAASTFARYDDHDTGSGRLTQSGSIHLVRAHGSDDHGTDDNNDKRSTQHGRSAQAPGHQKDKKKIAPVKPGTASGTVHITPVGTPIVTTPLQNGSVVHTKTVTYSTPGGPATMTLSVTTKNGVITAVKETPQAGGDSGRYQQRFAAGISQVAVGKSTAGFSLATVAGASLTTAAFASYVRSL